MAWVMVGWKSPPKVEYAPRCVGKIWPSVKKSDETLFGDHQRPHSFGYSPFHLLTRPGSRYHGWPIPTGGSLD